MKFFAPSQTPVHIGLTSGHTAHILPEPEGTELEPMFHREAIARGCNPEGVAKAPAADASVQFDRAKVIKEALDAMLDGKDEADFKKDGTPDLRMVTKRVGFTVQREEVEAIWTAMQDGAD